MMRKMGKAVSLLALTAALALGFSAQTKAGVVEPSGDMETNVDQKAIQEELNATGYVKLVEGKTYFLLHSIKVSSGQKIDATGATIITDDAIFVNIPDKTNYQSIDGLEIIGGKYLYNKEGGLQRTSIQFVHGNNITLKDMDIQHTNYDGHAIELISCSNVLVENCTIEPQGSSWKSGSVEEMLQIDVCTPKTAPRTYEIDPSLVDKSACKNVTVRGCTIKGCRAICTNYSVDMKTAQHTGILIENCNLTGVESEALALLNCRDAKILNNTINTTSKRVTDNKSSGLNIYNKYGTSLKSIVVNNNTIKGKKYAVVSWSENDKQYKKITMKNNKLYAKNKKQCLSLGNSFKKQVLKKNKQMKNKKG